MMSLPTLLVPMADTELIDPVASGLQLVIAALVGIALIVTLITWAKIHPFLALIVGGLAVGIVAGVDVADVITSFTTVIRATITTIAESAARMSCHPSATGWISSVPASGNRDNVAITGSPRWG